MTAYEKIKAALETSLAYAKARAEEVHQVFEGRLPYKHEIADDEVREIEEGIAALDEIEQLRAELHTIKKKNSELTLQALTDQAQELNMGYGAYVPEGYKLVPIYITDEIKEALYRNIWPNNFGVQTGAEEAWNEVLNVVPQPPAQDQPQIDERAEAEQEYTITAFDYERDPVGSERWVQFWKGWQARAAIAAQKEMP